MDKFDELSGAVQAGARRRTAVGRWLLGSLAVASSVIGLATVAQVAPPVDLSHPPESLKRVPRPEPSNLADFVADKQAAIALGKALFWDMQVGSDGRSSCATCHFQAGADTRSKNQLSPGLLRRSTTQLTNPDLSFQVGGPNHQLKLEDFPFHKFADPNNRNSAVLRSSNDVAASQGVYNERFSSISWSNITLNSLLGTVLSRDPYELTALSSPVENRNLLPDGTFQVGGINTRKVEPRNTPTVINAVFNFRNFWDGRAQYVFNGVNPFGLRDANAFLYKNVPSGLLGLGSELQQTKVRLDNASLASQASGPPLSEFEMSAGKRSFYELGKKMLYLRPLKGQKVSADDSVLGSRADVLGTGLTTLRYADLVRQAYRPEWWSGSKTIQVNPDGSRTLKPVTVSPAPGQYTQMQYNFSLFFALSIQLYEATLVSDDAPFDRLVDGDSSALTAQQAQGMGLFFGKGKCSSCHAGAEFSTASVRYTLNEPLQRMVMGDGRTAVYDAGFYNIAVTPTLEDIANGEPDPFGRPLSLTGVAQQGSALFKQLIGIDPKISVAPSERIAVNGAFKTPGLRNIELTAPYFHNGGFATLRQVVQHYNRGGTFHDTNSADLDADIERLGLSEDEVTALVEFLKSLTDDRVRFHKAPFDHPQLIIPNGHSGDTASVVNDGSGRARDDLLDLPSVGRNGYSSRNVPANFLATGNSGSPTRTMQARSSALCMDIGSALGGLVQQQACSSSASQKYQLLAAKDGSFTLASAFSAELAVPGSSLAIENAPLVSLGAGTASTARNWHVVDLGNGFVQLRNQASNFCIGVSAASSAAGALLVQQSCSSASLSQQFALR